MYIVRTRDDDISAALSACERELIANLQPQRLWQHPQRIHRSRVRDSVGPRCPNDNAPIRSTLTAPLPPQKKKQGIPQALVMIDSKAPIGTCRKRYYMQQANRKRAAPSITHTYLSTKRTPHQQKEQSTR